MGPPPFGDGDTTSATSRRTRSTGFNGATAFRQWKTTRLIPGTRSIRPLQWGHCLSTMEIFGSFTPLARMLPLQWGRRLSAMEIQRGQGTVSGHCVASMGPPPFGDGKGVEVNAVVRAGDASMGPPPFGDGKLWIDGGYDCCERASMRPPPFGDGKTCGNTSRCPSTSSFNGATAFRRWKAPATRCGLLPQLSLQWGHRLSAMESLLWGGMEAVNEGASMGPPPFGDGKTLEATATGGSDTSFNGATAFRRWKASLRWQSGWNSG